MDIIGWLGDCLKGIIAAVLIVLPNSPFAMLEMPEEIKEVLGYVNYYVPITNIMVMYVSWLSAILIYYSLRVILKWTKVD